MFGKKKKQEHTFDRGTLEPVIRCSICTGEKEAGFRDRRTGEFRGVQLIHTDRELAEFCREWGIEDIRTIY
ncbi:MAG: aspartate dehydrogenase [Clostridia bacterium]|nr:aspartate dehydrogenase [Clostridia bacterium]